MLNPTGTITVVCMVETGPSASPYPGMVKGPVQEAAPTGDMQ